MNIKVMTSNIRFDNPADGIHRWDNRRPGLVSLFEKIAPNIIATQEGRRPQLLDLEKQLHNFNLVDQHRSWITERMYPCFYIQKGLVEVLSSGDLWLSETPQIAGSSSFQSAFPRLLTWIKAKVSGNGPFLMVNVHLDHVLPSTREAQIKVLINECNKINQENFPLVLMGDFNEGPFDAVRKELTTSWKNIYDPWQSLGHGEESSHHSFGKEHDGSRIDWILLDKRLEVNQIEMHKNIFDQIYPSDHYPVSLSFRNIIT